MAHTIPLNVPGYGNAVVICNGDFSGTLQVRAWQSAQPLYSDKEEPTVSADLPHGFFQEMVKAYLYRKTMSAVESHLPSLLDRLLRL